MTSVILTRKEFGKKMKNKYNAFTSYLAKKARIFFLHQSPILESKCIIIGENEFAAAAKCAFFFSSSLLLSEVVNQNLAAAISRITTTAKVQSSADSWNG